MATNPTPIPTPAVVTGPSTVNTSAGHTTLSNTMPFDDWFANASTSFLYFPLKRRVSANCSDVSKRKRILLKESNLQHFSQEVRIKA